MWVILEDHRKSTALQSDIERLKYYPPEIEFKEQQMTGEILPDHKVGNSDDIKNSIKPKSPLGDSPAGGVKDTTIMGLIHHMNKQTVETTHSCSGQPFL